jgi:hypothetical protein
MRIVAAKSLSGFQLQLQFDNGESGVVDLSALAGRGVLAAWNTPGVFDRVTVTDDGAVEWPGEIDLCPDALYLQMTGKAAEEVFPALRDSAAHA